MTKVLHALSFLAMVAIPVALAGLNQLQTVEQGWKWVAMAAGVLTQLGAALRLFLAESPATQAKIRALAKAAATSALAIVLVFALGTSQAACTPAQQAVVIDVASEVLKDIEAGMTLDQIIQDIGRLIGGQVADGGAQVGEDIGLIVDDAIALLIDSGQIPANWLPAAKQMRAQLKAQGK